MKVVDFALLMAERFDQCGRGVWADECRNAARALTEIPPNWECGARKQGSAGGNEPADCDWPVCGCDPYADKVVDSLRESGMVTRPQTAVPKLADFEINAAVNAWFACPIEKRPSAKALGQRIAEIAVMHSVSEPVGGWSTGPSPSVSRPHHGSKDAQ